MEPFLAQIVMFGGNFAPRGWAFCEGQLLPIAQNSALFSLLGTIYGGDGRTTFALPDLRGRVAIQQGNGPGLPSYREGQKGGTHENFITTNQMPSHSHPIRIPFNSNGADTDDLEGAFLANQATDTYASAPTGQDRAGTFNSDASGGGQAVNNMPPFLAINFIIALQGTFPSRS